MNPTQAAHSDNTEPSPFQEITLYLADRNVTFTAAPACTTSNPQDPQDPWARDLVIYLTAGGNVAIYDPNDHTLDVRTLNQYISETAGTIADHTIDNILRLLPRPTEHLDI